MNKDGKIRSERGLILSYVNYTSSVVEEKQKTQIQRRMTLEQTQVFCVTEHYKLSAQPKNNSQILLRNIAVLLISVQQKPLFILTIITFHSIVSKRDYKNTIFHKDHLYVRVTLIGQIPPCRCINKIFNS